MKGALVFLVLAASVVGLLFSANACAPTAAPRVAPTATPVSQIDSLTGAIVQAGAAQLNLQQQSDIATVQAAQAIATINAARLDAETAQLVPLAQAQATNAAIDAAARLQSLSISATASAWDLQARSTAVAMQSLATAQAWSATATTTARDLRATAQADIRTATAEAWAAGATVAASNAQATTQAVTLEREQLDLERTQRTQPVRTWGPWVLLVLIIVALGFLTWRASIVLELRGRAIRRDARGDAPLMALAGPGGGIALIDPDRAFSPVVVVDGQAVSAPQLAPTNEHQERVTARDQAVDLKTRGLPQQARPAGARRVPMPMLAQPPAMSPVRIVEPSRVLPWLDEIEGQIILEGEK